MSRKKKQKQVSIEEYIDTYCQEKQIRGRYAVYVTEPTHSALVRIVSWFNSEHHTTLSSFVEAVITRHFEDHRKFLSEYSDKDIKRFMDGFRTRNSTEVELTNETPDGNDPESYRDNDSE